jgi:hypothetical protein
MSDYYRGATTKSAQSSENSRRRRSKTNALVPILGLLSVLCLIAIGVLVFIKTNPNQPAGANNLPTLSSKATEFPCTVLIQKAIEASGKACDATKPNTACYGNRTIFAELAPSFTGTFDKLGDMVDITQLLRLSAAPMNIEKQDWGIVIMKVLANLPNSLPGQTITMVVFGNTNFNKDAGDLHAFYFASTPGGLTCQAAPADGIMINVPNGTGVNFTVNGAEITLTGNASLQAVNGQEMRLNVYNGSALVKSNGVEKLVGPGQQTSTQLGGADGTTSTSAPSDPVPLSPADLALSCTLTGQNCGVTGIPTLSLQDIQATLQAAFGGTPTPGSGTTTGSTTSTPGSGGGTGSTPTPAPTRIPPGLLKKTTTPTPHGASSSSSDSFATPTPKNGKP